MLIFTNIDLNTFFFLNALKITFIIVEKENSENNLYMIK